MSKHLFGAIVTPHGVAANNRGENEGNMTTLQKILWAGEIYTTVSAEAIRWAIRRNWQDRGLVVNRQWDETSRQHTWNDPDFTHGGGPFIDDDLLGFMSAQAARAEANDDEAGPARRSRPRGTTVVRRSRFEVTRALSLEPWPGDVVFNVASIGATRSAGGRNPAPYSGEVHATRYQYGFALTPDSLIDRARAGDLIDTVIALRDVAGNHARFYFDFAPETVIFRWTDDFAPRMLYPFAAGGQGVPRVPELMRKVTAGDIDAAELVIGGALTRTEHGEQLRSAGAELHDGVKSAASAIKGRMGLS